MEGGHPRQALSAVLHGLATDANGVPFDGNYIIASGNLAADMYANVAAEATGRQLACRLYEMTDDEGMKDMLAYLIARHDAPEPVARGPEDLGGTLPVPSSFGQEKESRDYNSQFVPTFREQREDPGERRTQGTSIDGEGSSPTAFNPVAGRA